LAAARVPEFLLGKLGALAPCVAFYGHPAEQAERISVVGDRAFRSTGVTHPPLMVG